MKTKSRILAALIAFIMIVGMLPISAFAEGEATPPAGEAPVQTQGDPTEEQPSPTSYTLTLKAEPDGGGTVEGGGSYGAGTEVTVTATASDGYVFTAWYEDAEERGDEDKRSEDAEYTFTLNGDLTLCAVFTQQPQADEQTPATPTDGEPGENTDDESGDTGDGATGGKQEAPAAPTFTVTFDANGHGEAPEAASVTEGETVEKPDDPAEEGFSFNGWYRDKEATDPWDFDTDTISGDIRLYASWTEAEPEPELATLSRTANGGTLRGSAPWAGSGTEKDPWKITSAADLAALREFMILREDTTQGKYFLQTEDISLSAYCGSGKGDWTPLGSEDASEYFKGTYDGGGHTVSGLYIENGGRTCRPVRFFSGGNDSQKPVCGRICKGRL